MASVAAEVDFHEPAMLAEVLEVFSGVPDGWLVDATVGGGGHSDALLDAHRTLSVLGIDADDEAIAAAGARLARHGERVRLCRRRFDEIAEAVGSLPADSLAGALFDLGVSSHQLDAPERGFGFRVDGPLDMRMDRSRGTDASRLVNRADEQSLARLLRDNADEQHARRIAAAIVAARPINGTAHLAEVIAAAVPARARRRRGHSARKTFQALRIEVNSELAILGDALSAALGLLAPRGRCAVLSYHSGEDRIVKRIFREAAGEVPRPRPDLPPPPGTAATVRLLWRGVRTPCPAEIARNPRASAARLRAVEKLPEAL